MNQHVLSIWKGDLLVTEPKPTMKAIKIAVAAKHGMAVDELLTRSTKHRYAHARQEAMWHMRKLGKSFPQIAASLGLKDHTGVIHGVKAHERRMAAQ